MIVVLIIIALLFFVDVKLALGILNVTVGFIVGLGLSVVLVTSLIEHLFSLL